MAIKLNKAIRRETLALKSRDGKPIVAYLLPGDCVGFKTKGSRLMLEVSLGHCYRLAEILLLHKLYEEKTKQYEIKKKCGKKTKRPKRPILPFNKMYFKALGK